MGFLENKTLPSDAWRIVRGEPGEFSLCYKGEFVRTLSSHEQAVAYAYTLAKAMLQERINKL
jgi:hypothetical protein